MNCTQKLAATLAAFAVASATAASASEWRWSLTPYAWATDVGIDVEVADRQLVDETIAIEDLLEDLETIAQVRLEAQKGAHGLFLDLFDVTLSDDAQTVALPSGDGEATFTPEMGMTILDLGAIYDPHGDQEGFQLLYGARVLNQRATIEAEVVLASGAPRSRELEIDDTFVDALVGFRYLRRLGDRFTLQAQADVSKGGTELTWSAGPTLGYRFGKSGRYTALAGYRRLVVDFDTAESVDAKMTLSGALVGLRIAF
ncbi:MAG: hypothetical protein NDJ75_01860 [Thermoanaerobaculia bacterium]|nr:hypothetical protein [Thermoanaerobaculia bacterium]